MRLPVLRTEDAEGDPADVRLSGLLGEGGMGRVVSAEQVALRREVAVKVLRALDDEHATDGGSLAHQILSAMEAAANGGAAAYSRYGSSVHKQVSIDGALDRREVPPRPVARARRRPGVFAGNPRRSGDIDAARLRT